MKRSEAGSSDSQSLGDTSQTSAKVISRNSGVITRIPADFESCKRFLASVPALHPVFEDLAKQLMSWQGVEWIQHKTQISFKARRGFAWVWLAIRPMKNRPKVYFVLSFGLPARIESPRIVEVVEPRPGYWTHHLLVESARDLDVEVWGWLRQAYDFALRPPGKG